MLSSYQWWGEGGRLYKANNSDKNRCKCNERNCIRSILLCFSLEEFPENVLICNVTILYHLTLLNFVFLKVMAVAGISPEGKARGGDQPGIWLTPPPSPGPHGSHRVRSSYHTPSPRLLHHHDKGTSSLSTSNNNLTKEPLAQRHSTGDLAMARDPSAAFYKSLTRPKPREPMIPKSNSKSNNSEDVRGSADSLVAQVRLLLPHSFSHSSL